MEHTASATRMEREAFFEELYHTAFPRVARLVQKRGGNLEDAKDIFQEAVICFYEKSVRDELNIRTSTAAYVVGIARHLWLRRCARGPETIALEGMPLPDDAHHREEETPGRRQGLLRYLESAGRRCMDLLQAFYYHRLSMREIAEEFGYKGERSATVQKYKCLEKVRNKARKKESVAEFMEY